MSIPSRRSALPTVQHTALAALVCLLLAQAVGSLRWRMEHDTPLLHYAAYLMETYGAVPYRDLFETSMPGTFGFHYLVGRLFGYGDLAFRWVDLSLLALLLAATYRFMSRFGRQVGAWSAVVFGIVYFSHGQTMSLQRDYIGIVPIALSLLLIPRGERGPSRGWSTARVGLVRFAFVGLLFGSSFLIKPHLIVGLPLVWAALYSHRRDPRGRSFADGLSCAAASGLAFLVPTVVAVTWLVSQQAWDPFVSMVTDYLPLHQVLTGSHEIVGGKERASYLIAASIRLGGYMFLALSALCGYVCAFHRVRSSGAGSRNTGASASRTPGAEVRDETMARSLNLLVLCAASYAVYPTLAGKFWPYHYAPLAYFLSISGGLCLLGWRQGLDVHGEATNGGRVDARTSWPHTVGRWVPFLALITFLTLQVDLPNCARAAYHDVRSDRPAHAPKGGRVDEIAAWLTERLEPGDTVQPLDWTGGSVHAMLLAKARLATRFLHDYEFYHHVSTPYVQELRTSFLSQFEDAAPRFVIEVFDASKPWVSGLDTSRSFPELEAVLRTDYSVAFAGDGYRIYERTKG
ncbi:MAG: hypothetical protein H6682_09315 [Candidatus Eisenbacteria bacterium]|nr:hypothetical protein [Candidatus Eisenbacteria bacterium]